MKKNLILSLFFLALVQFSFAQVKWEADFMHSNARFEVQHNGISFVDGEFTEMEGQVESPAVDNFDGATFNFTIQVNSIDTRIEARNQHLLTDDFFNAEKYPEITLKNAKLSKKEGNKYALKGELTVRDVTKTVVFDMTYNGSMSDDQGKIHAGFTGSTTIDRTEFNINYNDKLPSGIDAVGKDIKIVVNTEIIKQD